MALSVFCKKVMRAGLANRVAANELIAAVDTLAVLSDFTQGTAVAAVGTLATVGAATGTLATVSAPLGPIADVGAGAIDNQCALKADVDARFETVSDAIDVVIGGVDARVLTLQLALDATKAATDERVTTLQAKVDALTASLRTANIIAT